jgi:hypothetical protein
MGRPRGQTRARGRGRGQGRIRSTRQGRRVSSDDEIIAERLEEEREILAVEEGLLDGEDNEDEETSEREEISAAQPPPNSIPIPDKVQQQWVGWRIQFFEDWRKGEDGVTYAKCKLCTNSQYFAGSLNAFSNYGRHLRRKHPEEWKNRSIATTAKPNNQYLHILFLKIVQRQERRN